MVVLVHHSTTLTVEKPDYAMHAVMNAYVSNQRTCRRSILNGAMDGNNLKCDASQGDELCDICQPNTEMTRLIKDCSRIGHLPKQGCLKSISDSPVQESKKAKDDDDEDAWMYASISNAAIAELEMPNSLEVHQVSDDTLPIRVPAVSFSHRPISQILLLLLAYRSKCQMLKKIVTNGSNCLASCHNTSLI